MALNKSDIRVIDRMHKIDQACKGEAKFVGQIVKITGVLHDTVYRYLDSMIDEGFILKVGGEYEAYLSSGTFDYEAMKPQNKYLEAIKPKRKAPHVKSLRDDWTRLFFGEYSKQEIISK
jgi:hypothetical protein